LQFFVNRGPASQTSQLSSIQQISQNSNETDHQYTLNNARQFVTFEMFKTIALNMSSVYNKSTGKLSNCPRNICNITYSGTKYADERQLQWLTAT